MTTHVTKKPLRFTQRGFFIIVWLPYFVTTNCFCIVSDAEVINTE